MRRYTVNSGEITLSAAATKSLILINPSAHRVEIISAWIAFGSDPGEDPRVEIYRVTTLGSPAGTTAVFAKTDPGTGNAETSGLVNLTTEPTAVEVIDSWKGPDRIQFPFQMGRQAPAAGARLGMRVTTATGVAPTVVAGFEIFE